MNYLKTRQFFLLCALAGEENCFSCLIVRLSGTESTNRR